MADIAAQSQLDHGGGYGIGYRPVGSPLSPRYTVTKSIKNNNNGTATVTLTVTVRTNSGYIGTGYYLTLNFSCGGKSVSSLWKGDQASWAQNSTYSKSISITNVPLGTSTTASASLSVTIGKQSWQAATTGFTFNSTTYSGNQITGLPLGYTTATFNSASNFTSTASSITVSISAGSSGTATKVAVFIGSTTIKTTSAVTGNITSISLAAADQTRIHNAVPNSTTATVTFVMTTQRSASDTTVVGTATKTATVTIGSTIVPTLASITATEAGSRGNLTGNNFAVTHSRIKFTMGTQTAGAGASISSRKITFNGTTYDGATATTGAIGTSGNITATATITDSRGRTASRSVVCTMVVMSPHSFTSFSNFNHNSSTISVSITRQHSGVTATAQLKLGSKNIGDPVNVNAGATSITLTAAMQSTLLTSIPAASATASLVVTSYMSGIQVGSTTRSATCSIASSIQPTLSSISVSEGNSTVTALALPTGNYVKGLSDVRVTMNSPKAGSGATISSRTVYYGATAYSYGTTTLSTGIPASAGGVTIKGRVVDSRNRSVEKSASITVLEYASPRADSVDIFRANSSGVYQKDGTYMRINHTLRFSKLLGKNTLTFSFRTRVSGTSTWSASSNSTTWTETSTLPTYTRSTGTYPTANSYEVEITLVDKLGRSTVVIGQLPTAEYPLVLGPNNVGVGKIPNAAYKLDVSGNTRIDGSLLINKSHPAAFRQNIGLDIQHGDYRRSVIAFANTSEDNSWCTGILNMHRVNGLQGVATAHISIEKKYNASTIHSSILKFGAGGSTSIRPCTFTYGGIKYGGVEVFIADAHFVYGELMVTGGNFTPFGLDYYDTRGTVLNAEVNSSIEFSSPTQVGTLYHNGTSVGGSSYTLPTASASTLGGIKVGANLSISSGVLRATNTTYSAATTSAAGLMSAADKTKLNGIATGATADPTILTSTSGGTARCVRYPNGWQTLTWRRTLTTTITNASGGMFYSNSVLAQTNWPWAFSETPTVSVTVGGQGQLTWCGHANMASATQSPNVYLYKGSSDTNSRTYEVHIIAQGRWK